MHVSGAATTARPYAVTNKHHLQQPPQQRCQVRQWPWVLMVLCQMEHGNNGRYDGHDGRYKGPTRQYDGAL